MKISQLCQSLNYELILNTQEDAQILNGYTSDLLSDVMANAEDNSCLITIQAHKNSVAVASLIGIKLLILCNDRSAPEDMLDAARKEGIAIACTSDNQFTASYKIFKQLDQVHEG